MDDDVRADVEWFDREVASRLSEGGIVAWGGVRVTRPDAYDALLAREVHILHEPVSDDDRTIAEALNPFIEAWAEIVAKWRTIMLSGSAPDAPARPATPSPGES